MRRIDWIDSLKGFGIFCVTLGHLGCNFLLETHIYSFHMFLFFFLSGFLHSNCGGDFEKYISKKTKTLFVPFLMWNVISCLAGLLMTYSISETIRLFFVGWKNLLECTYLVFVITFYGRDSIFLY